MQLTVIKWATDEELRNLKGIIYRIVNIINGKSYIGKSINTFYNRYKGNNWWKHNYVLSKILVKAIKKYGPQNFKIQILEKNIDNQESLLFFESFYAKLYNSYNPNGYNLIECGLKGGDRSKTVYLRDENENLIKITNITKWCKNNRIKDSNIFRVLCGKEFYYRGYHLPKFTLNECIKLGKIKYTKTYIIKYQEKNFIVKNLEDFCFNNNLSVDVIRNIFYKRKFSLPYKGIISVEELL